MQIDSLLQSLQDGKWHAALSLQSGLQISQQELTSAYNKLVSKGLELDFDSELGYKLPNGIRLLDRESILAGLSHSFRNSLAHFSLEMEVDSTNSQAMNWLRSGASGRALFLAEGQTEGRGRRGRSWLSPLAHNIMLSLVWPVADKLRALEGFSLVIALSVVEALRSADLSGMEALGVKWPNDVWVGSAKLAGILLELHGGQSENAHVVIGIGVNVHMPQKSLETIVQPVSDLYSQGNESVDRNQLVAALLVSLEKNLSILHERGFEEFRQQWSLLDVFKERPVQVTGHGDPVNGVVKGVSSTGALILATNEGARQLAGGEIAPSVRSLAESSTIGEQ